jgi:hypothetical protein
MIGPNKSDIDRNGVTVFAATAIAVALLLGSPGAWAGGGDFGDDDDQAEAGPSYFGFVKDSRGDLIPEAKVVAELKNRATLVTHSDDVGVYKIPGFGKDIDPADVEITCSKAGYKDVIAVKRPPGADASASVQADCTLSK